jgi:acetoin utilization deacetylase AcuC-like enzyme
MGMILYDASHPMSFYDFGIQIPIFESKAQTLFRHLMENRDLAAQVQRWHVDAIQERVEREDLLRVHTPEYVDRLSGSGLEEEILRTYELIDAEGRYRRYDPGQAKQPLSILYSRILERVAGSCQCCRLALQHGFCFSFGGGMHHAQADRGAGFCLVNDILVAVRKLQAEGLLQRTWIIDVDAHKGDGTAAITRDDPSITTLSLHMANGWPLDGEERDALGRQNPSFIPSSIDVPIACGEEGEYLPRLRQALERLASFPSPDLAVVVSGADPYEHDELESAKKLRLSLEQLLERDLTISRFLEERSLPAAYLMAGGYGRQAWRVYAQFLERVLPERLQREIRP